MTMLLILGAAMVLVSIYLVAAAIPSSEPRGLNRSLAVLEAMTDAPKELTARAENGRSPSGSSSRCRAVP